MGENRWKMIIDELSMVLSAVDSVKIEELALVISKAPRVFCAGAGRSGYMMRAFTMRLMHCGKEAYFIGDSSTPGAAFGDVLVIGTGSGETGSLAGYAEKAKKLGVRIIAITAFSSSKLGRMSDLCIELNAPTPKSTEAKDMVSVQPMGTLFEQSLLLCLDGAVIEVMKKLGLSSEDMFERHANLE